MKTFTIYGYLNAVDEWSLAYCYSLNMFTNASDEYEKNLLNYNNDKKKLKSFNSNTISSFAFYNCQDLTSYDIPYGVVKIRIFKYYRYLQQLQKSNQKHSRTSTMLTFISMGVKNQIIGLIYSIIQELITFMFHWITKEKNIFLELKLYSQRDILFRLLLLKLMLIYS